MNQVDEERVLILAPTWGDKQLTQKILAEAAISCHPCADLGEVTEQFGETVGAVLLTDDMLAQGNVHAFVEAIETQPPWSDLPIILLSAMGEESPLATWTVEQLGNVTVLERRVRLTTLVSTLRSALRARRRQYQLRDQLDALRESEGRFRMLADNMSPLAWTCDTLGNTTWYNRRWLEYTGCTFDEGKESGWVKYQHPDHLERILASVAHSSETGEPWEETFPLRGKDGRYRWFLSRAVPIHDAQGEIVCWFGTNTDVDDQLRAEEALRNNESRLADEAAALARLNELSSRLWRSSSLQKGLDIMLDATIELLGADMGNVQLLDSDEKVLRIAAHRGFPQVYLEAFREVSAEDHSAGGRALRAGERIVIEDVDADPRYKSYRHIARAAGYRAVQSTPLLGRDGTPLGTLSTHFRAPHLPGEQDLHRLELFARQAADFIERCRSDEALREADRRKDEFLAMLAHELRNPLAPIRTGLQVLQLSSENSSSSADTLHMMDRQLRQLVRLIDDLLDISRITRGKIELRRERCNIATILSMAIEGSRPLIEAAGVELTVTLPRRDMELDADPARLAQVFSNLLTNAAKYTDRGGHIWLTAEQRADEVLVVVRDSGIGIRPEMLSRIFEMFTQVDRSDRSGGGLGIGLSLVRGLVDMHGGRVEAHSDGPGQGSEFIVRLPVVDRVKLLQQESPDAAADSAHTRRVLVVDDNRDAAKFLSILLRTMGNEVETAHDGLEAVAVSEAFRPDVVLLDLGMPKANGYEAAKRIRQQPWGKEITIVALTGWGQEKDRRRTKEAGFDVHLVKPIGSDALAKVLARCDAKSARDRESTPDASK